MVVGEMASFSMGSSFRMDGKAESAAARAGSGMKSFMNGVMSPFTACWQPDPASCVPGCSSDYHIGRHSKNKPAVVSPLMDRVASRYEGPTSPDRYLGDARKAGDAEQEQLPTKDIEKPHSNDVLCGRGGSSNRHLGNMHFRELVAANKKTYVGLTKKQKMMVARKIVEMVHTTSPPGRFLAKDLDTGLWYDIGLPRSLEKTSQALREKNSNDYPAEQGTEVTEVLSEASLPCSPRSDTGVSSPTDNSEKSSKSSRSSKNVEAPPLTIPPHLADIYGPKKARESQHRQLWPEYNQGSQPLEQPYLHQYGPPSPAGTRDERYALPPRARPYDMSSPRSPHHYPSGPPAHYGDRRPAYGYPDSPPRQDYREQYDYQRRMEHRDPYGQPSPHRAPPPGPHYRAYPPPQHPPGPPPGHPHAHRRFHRPVRPPVPHPAAMPVSPPHGPSHPGPPSASYEHPSTYRQPYYYTSQPARSAPPSSASSVTTPPMSPMSHGSSSVVSLGDSQVQVVKSPSNAYIRSKSEVSPERRQEWKRQRKESGGPRRLNSDSSLSHAVENSLSLEEKVIGRERAKSGRDDTSKLDSKTREILSPSGVLQGRSRPRNQKEEAASLKQQEEDAVSALSGLAALSTAAFLKLDETN